MLNLVAAILFAIGAVVGSTLGSVNGAVPFSLFVGLLAAGFGARFAGCTYAIAKGEWSMPWGLRATSWLLLGGAAILLGLAGAVLVVAAFAGIVVLDAMTGFVKKEVKEKPRKARRRLWTRVRLPLFVGLYLAFVVAFHFYVSRYLSYGTLVTWTLLALGFVVALRAAIVGPKAPESWLRAPADHRTHEFREHVVPDPHRLRAEQVLAALRARGDAGAFLQFVRDTAHEAGLFQTSELEQRILASFARAGTRRDEDIAAALAEVERFLSTRKVSQT